MLTNGETNIRLGTLYFKRLIQQFGGTYYALASYNAGENRVVRWKAERPGMDEDEFIDDIPFPETQNYVKRILGTAEDYRRLYGDGAGQPRPRREAGRREEAGADGEEEGAAEEEGAGRRRRRRDEDSRRIASGSNPTTSHQTATANCQLH